MQKVKYSLIVVGIVLASSIGTYFFGPKQIEYKEKIKYVEIEKTQVRTIKQTIKRPDGTNIETVTKEAITESKKSSDKETLKKITPKHKDWIATVAISHKQTYTGIVQRRILGLSLIHI